eukprot:TRINITY_DN3668_c1_g1_i1.p1 TRINITY_DN3668_c1_g1~~TRINITY_DN3668_c1_g1_i1.p1  ORF type:complete len:202 (+),score=32.05 TRINITY_DN3668_c1_g1_i1:63-668(+)
MVRPARAYSGGKTSGGKSGGKGSVNASGRGGAVSDLLANKPYKQDLEEVCKTTVVRVGDFDQRLVQLLDYHNEGGKAGDACNHLKQALKGLTREHVSNWRAYVYVLVRQFDEKAYKEMKENSESRRSRLGSNDKSAKVTKQVKTAPVVTSSFAFNPDAVAFVPGSPNHTFVKSDETTAELQSLDMPPAEIQVTADETSLTS